MSVLVERSMGELNKERKPVYPLFQKTAKPPVSQLETARSATEATVDPKPSASALQNIPEATAKKTKRPKTINPLVDPDSSSTNTPTFPNSAGLLDVDPNSGRRKRRKTEENKAGIEGSEDQIEAARPVSRRQPRQRKQQNEPQADVECGSTNNGQSSDVRREGAEDFRDGTQHIGRIQSLSELSGASQSPPLEAPTLPNEGLIGAASIQSNAKSCSNSTVHSEPKPKKVLRLNPKTGTIGSPPTKNPCPPLEDPLVKKARRAKVSLSSNKKTIGKSKVVTIRYSLAKGVGQKIDQIMNSTKPIIPLPSKVQPQIEKSPATPTKPKALHPLFLGKAATKKSTPQKSAKNNFIDLTSAKESPRPRSRDKSSPIKPGPMAFSGFGVAKIMKVPGAVEPAWPWKDMVHIRGIDPDEALPHSDFKSSQVQIKKSKYHAIEVSPTESIIGTLAGNLCIQSMMEEIRDINPNEYPPVPACLRVPKRHYESGLEIQKRVLKELHTRPILLNMDDQNSSEDEIQVNKKTRVHFYPAKLSKLYSSIATSFSAFDYGQCETKAWIQKYAPTTAAEVLQAGTEAGILKSWLQNLVVQSVESGLGDRCESGIGRSKTSKFEKSSKKKRKKKLDDFIVSTEDEDDDMDEITEPEDTASPSQNPELLKKTVIRARDVAVLGSNEAGKLANSILISGPHGCGKTAAVYAVAKELGFEVFEINSSSRRNGRDIIERVGDMTRNHQVRRSSDVPVADPVDDDNQRIDDALANDLKSGRQGTMNSFFKPKQETKQITKQETKPEPSAKTETKKIAGTQRTLFPKAPAKQQKQSLILLEEVDILYKEDTQFWATVLSLISISKRPIIMTCNDESVVPLASLTLHAILRFAPPPVDLAVDYMLLVAACEGHVLWRQSVKSLYEGRNLDLRASLTELNFWCQFAVGDVKRGLSWYYPRWSQAEDVDENGNTIRVVSEGTYQTGMGWLSQDFLESDIHHLDIEEEMLHEVYDGWNADVSEGPKVKTGMNHWAKKIQSLSTGNTDNKAALEMYADHAEAMSSADLCSGGIFAPKNKIGLDFSLPELSQKAKDDYILAHDILEATPLVSYDQLGKDISLWMQSRSRNYFQVDQHVKHNFEVPVDLACPSEGDLIRLISAQRSQAEVPFTRKILSRAFDPLAEPEKQWVSPAAMELCSFDRITPLITEDLAPYIRSIVAYDSRLQQERAKLSNLMSEGGQRGKRARTTRSAMSAREGGTRKTTRKDRWFTAKVNPYDVMRTGMQSWSDAAAVEALRRAEEMATSSVATSSTPTSSVASPAEEMFEASKGAEELTTSSAASPLGGLSDENRE